MPTMISEATANQRITQASDPAPALTGQFEVGDWRVLPELNRIQHRREDLQRQLEPRLIHLLCYLAANSNQVLSRQALVAELWPTVVVNENSLTRAISELRKQMLSPDSVEQSNPTYIETIPKRGYRLLPAGISVPADRVETRQPQIKASAVQHGQQGLSQKSSWLSYLMPQALMSRQWERRAAVSALCLSLLIGSWLTLDFSGRFNSDSERKQLADELLESAPEYFGGELSLSTMDEPQLAAESIAKPVVSLDEKQYAFIQYDSAGSTIFLGGLGTAKEPVPVFNSRQHLFNLSWAPVGNNLLFAMKPVVTTAALYSSLREGAELVLLDLDTLETNRLIKEQIPNQQKTPAGSNLT